MRFRYVISPYFGEPFDVQGTKIVNANTAYTIYDEVSVGERRPPIQYAKWTAPHHSVKQIHGHPIFEVER